MRGCVAHFLLALLLAANGYTIWQVRGLRAEVAALQRNPPAVSAVGPEVVATTARSALRAVRRGEMGEARDELEQLSRQLAGLRDLTSQRKALLQARIAAARQALAGKSGKAAARVEDIVDELSHKVPEEAQGDGHSDAEP